MESSRKQRWQQLQAVFEPGFKQMLLVSFLVHLLVPVLYYTPLFPKKAPEKPPVYKVNLVNKPVLNPQAGRPEAVQSKAGAATAAPKPKPLPAAKPLPPKPQPEPVKPKALPKAQPKPEPKPAPKPQAKPQAKPEPKAAAKPAPKPEPKPAVSKTQEDLRDKRIAEMMAERKARQDKIARDNAIAVLKANVEAESSKIESPVANAPVGMLDGKGDEAGVSAVAFVQEYIQQNWSFPKYMATGNPEAEVVVSYDKSGALRTYKFIRESGDTNFDESLKKAFLRSKQLPQSLPEAMTFEVVFNLKEMLDKP